jgi:hypothetical protein
MFVCCVCCVGSSLCEELITRSEESYRVCLIVCDLETSNVRRPRPDWGSYATQKKKRWHGDVKYRLNVLI